MLRVLRPALRVRGAAPRALSSAPPAGPHIVPDELVNSNGGLLEYSVVYTDRAMNHMSAPFGVVMRELHEGLCSVYNTEHAVLIPGSGTYGMEAVARQFGGHGRKCMAIRNGARGTRVGVFVARAAVCVCVYACACVRGRDRASLRIHAVGVHAARDADARRRARARAATLRLRRLFLVPSVADLRPVPRRARGR